MTVSSKPRIQATLFDNRVIVWDAKHGSSLYREGFYGKPIGIRKPKDFNFEKPLELSLLETLYLVEKGRISVQTETGKELTREELLSIASQRYEGFNNLYLVYKDLRDKGYVVRPGMKFGANFAVYKYGPGIDHAPFLVHVMPLQAKIDPIEVVRAGRLSHSVKKKFIVAVINQSTGAIDYLMFSWVKF
ncbi:MAG: tRNA-intron lyase [Candidatus Nezhaarchaeales archaeon]